ncbi:cytochrome b [Ramlibacter humi]|uniref:Cytochrome b n=2 Tax=Ramlibacter humi TaxID=2530451 RepID=A0A4Z0BNE9_9BURK|nr:cytochrome b [Ramlibacter humi]TFZ00361.1 cytochrome b [Ramlibacter humi]
MVPWTNDIRRYGAVAMLLHWGMAILLAGLLILGLYMVALPDAGYDRRKITLILVHKAVGMLALGLVLVRAAWRTANPLPAFAAGLPGWQQVAARVVHLCFYALMLALPLTGWLMSSAGGYPVPVFEWFNAPDLIATDEHLFRALIALHRWLAYALVVLLALHAGAALWHHFARRDDTLRKMLP